MRLGKIEETVQSMQDIDSQLAEFTAWLDSVEGPLSSLYSQTEDKADREDRDRVRVWLQQQQVRKQCRQPDVDGYCV